MTPRRPIGVRGEGGSKKESSLLPIGHLGVIFVIYVYILLLILANSNVMYRITLRGSILLHVLTH
jgi:hypothetical protein